MRISKRGVLIVALFKDVGKETTGGWGWGRGGMGVG